MADTENLVKFGYLNYADMLIAIDQKLLEAYSICFTKDTKLTYLINDKLEPIQLKTKVPIYSSPSIAIEEIKNDLSAYEGEIISVYDDDRFQAYIINRWSESGELYIKPIYDPSDIDYNTLTNIPIKNISGSVSSPIILSNIPDGTYKVTGVMECPDGKTITSIVGNMVIVSSENLNQKNITRISTEKIFRYSISNENVKTEEYITDVYLESQGFATENYVNTQIAGLDCVTHEELAQYVEYTVELLVIHIVNEQLNNRMCTEDDIVHIFDDDEEYLESIFGTLD